MIKPINISPINTTRKYYYECKNCKEKGTVTFTNRIINVNNEDYFEELEEEQCPHCGILLENKNETQR